MSKARTYSEVFGEWQRMVPKLEANADELGHLRPQWTKLGGLLTEGIEINKQQEAMAASKQEASKRLQVIITEGERLANILRLSLKEHYGIRSEKLAEFGLQPFRGRKVAELKAKKRARQEAEATPPAEEPPTSSTV